MEGTSRDVVSSAAHRLEQFVVGLDRRQRGIFELWSGQGDGCPYDVIQISAVYNESPSDIELTLYELREEMKARAILHLLPSF
jgi:hypothetical protein